MSACFRAFYNYEIRLTVVISGPASAHEPGGFAAGNYRCDENIGSLYVTGKFQGQTSSGYDCVYAVYEACTTAGVTSDMSASDICDAMVAMFGTGEFSFSGLTGADMTWSANGEVSKSPMAVVIKDGVYTAA